MLASAKRWVAALLLAAAGLLTWGSWYDPALSNYARPATFVIFDAPDLQPGADSVRLQAHIAAWPGVTACAIRPARQLLVVAYNPDSLSEQQLSQRLGLVAQPPPPPSSDARQCPVPAGYVQALEQLRFACNLRRLWVHL